jgi:Rrf2 family protein
LTLLQLTKRTEYGLIALTHLAQGAGGAGTEGPDKGIASVREICERFPVPRRLLAEILKDLCHAGLVESHRGSSGGYSLARPAATISVGDVVAALEGAPSLASCASAGHQAASPCEVESVCPIRDPIETLRQELWRLLCARSLAHLARHPRMQLAAPTAGTSSITP